jgi:predicted amidohydrolase
MGEQIHCALWYSLASTGPLVEAAARLHAIESGAWVVVAVQYNAGAQEKDSANLEPNWRSQGGSVIVSPAGEYVAGPIYGEETILYADIDPAARRAMKAVWDPIGREGRPDVFDFSIRRGAKGMSSESPLEIPIQLPEADREAH